MTAFLQVCGKDVCMETLLSIQALARLPWQLPLLQPSQGGLQSMHSTAPGMFASAASLKADSGFRQQRHESTRPSQRRVTQPGPGQHRASWATDGVEEQVEGSEVIDLIGSPGRMSKACCPAQSICCLCTVGRKESCTLLKCRCSSALMKDAG